jgi:hypothetical protein
MRSSTMAVTALAVLAAGVNVHASDTSSSRTNELRRANERAQWQASQTKGGPQQLLVMKRQRVSSLVDRLERGEAVDPREIGRLLESQD